MTISFEDVQLIREIHDAFAGVAREHGMSWHEAEAVDNYATIEERRAARLVDVDARWEEIPDALFDDLPSAVWFLDAAALRYYLPAFLIADLNRSGSWKSSVDEGFVDKLLRTEELDPMLTSEQKRAIFKWLRRRRPELAEVRSPERLWLGPARVFVAGDSAGTGATVQMLHPDRVK